ncbi:MAG: S-layer homology domain-containing protein [Oscillospiraceae bacterium]|nr:S-layer homology domain-containing protein [Oscillospiraceae bacterium]
MKFKQLRNLSAIVLIVVMLIAPMTTVWAAQADAIGSTQAVETPITRGEFAMLVSTAFSLSAESGLDNFSDVPADHPFADGILAVKSNGYMVGNSTGNFFPNAMISGAEATVLLNNVIGFDGARVTQVQGLAIPAWAVPAASVILDLTMVDRALIEQSQLTMHDAMEFIYALLLATLIPQGTPYALQQAELRDNFFAYINRQFLATGAFTPGSIMASTFNDVSYTVMQQQEQILTEILSNPNHTPGSAQWNIRELFYMFMDNEARTASISRLDRYFDAIRGADSIEELLAVAERYSTYFAIMPYYGLSFVGDARVDATQWAAIVSASPMDLGSAEFYVDDPALHAIHAAYIEYVVMLLAYIGETEDLEARAEAVFEIEQARAAKLPPAEAAVDPQELFAETTWERLIEATSVTRSLTFNAELFELALEMNVYSNVLEYIEFIESLYVEENLQVLRDVALLNVLMSFSSVLGDDFAAMGAGLHTAIFGEVGGAGLTLEQRAQSFVTSQMWRTFSRLYYQRFSSEAIKRDVTEMTEDIRATMRDMIGELTWMSEETQVTAIEKLDSVRAFIAFPDEPLEELNITVRAQADGGCLIDFRLQLSSLGMESAIEMIQGSAESNVWEMVPTSIVNAFYAPMDNAIIIPAGILQYPFYSPDATREQNLGGIGAVIAHEFTHAFDPYGSQFDKVGTLNNWWTEADYAAFNAFTDRVAGILDQIVFVGDIHLNGAFSAGETIADLGAMEAVLTVAAQMPDADLSLVMESWARIWAARITPEVAQFLIFNSPHLPMKMRVNFILAQLDEFHEVFGTTPGDGMHVPEEERLSFWW